MDISKLMEQAQAFNSKMQKTNAEIEEAEYIGEAQGLVKVVMDGKNRIQKVDIDPEILNRDDKEMLESMIMIAVNDAAGKLDETRKEKLGALTNGMKIPGM